MDGRPPLVWGKGGVRPVEHRTAHMSTIGPCSRAMGQHLLRNRKVPTVSLVPGRSRDPSQQPKYISSVCEIF